MSKWTIKKLNQKTSFEGLGQIAKIDLPIGTTVMVNQQNHILSIPGITGSVQNATKPNSTNFLVEVANFDGEMVAINNHRIGGIKTDSAKIWTGQISEELVELFYERLYSILKEESYLD